jgi:hypothetical protein
MLAGALAPAGDHPRGGAVGVVVVLDPAHPRGHGQQLPHRDVLVSATVELGEVVVDRGVHVEKSAADGDPGEQRERRLRGRVAEQAVLCADPVGVPLMDENAVHDDDAGRGRREVEELGQTHLAPGPDDARCPGDLGSRPGRGGRGRDLHMRESALRFAEGLHVLEGAVVAHGALSHGRTRVFGPEDHPRR